MSFISLVNWIILWKEKKSFRKEEKSNDVVVW